MDKDIEATITERSGSVYALLPKGTDFAGTPLIPVFETKGTLTVNGSPIQSGTTPVNFGEEVKLTVTSKNGLFTKEYTVLLQESGAVIYVDLRACGRNNGTSWEDAFISFDRAIEAANAIPADSVIEIYLTENDTPYTYDSDAYPLKRANLIIRGGFTGTETTPEERPMITNAKGNLVPEHKTIITNDNNLTFICHNQTGGSLTFDSLDLIYGRNSIGLLDLSISKTAQSIPQVNYQNCRIKYAYNMFGIDIDNNSKKDIDITFTDTEISVDKDSHFITHDGTSLVNTVIKDSTFKIPGLYCDANSSNLEIINSDITNSSTSSFSLYCSNIVARDSTFNGGKGTMSVKLKTKSQIAEYYNCTLNEVNDISCTVMEDCTITNTLGKTYGSSLISSLGNTRITRTRIDSNTNTDTYGLIGFTGNDYDNYDVEITDSHININTDSANYFLTSPCNLTIRGTGADSSSCTISTDYLFNSDKISSGNTKCSVIIENAQIHAERFNYFSSEIYGSPYHENFIFNEMKILDSQITSSDDLYLPLCNKTVIKNSSFTAQFKCEILAAECPLKPESLEITGSTFNTNITVIGNGINTVIKDNKMVSRSTVYLGLRFRNPDSFIRNYELQGNTIDSNRTSIGFYSVVTNTMENIKLNNNNFSNCTDISVDGDMALDLFEFNGNSLNTTREITSGTGDIIDAYYSFSLQYLPSGTILNFENTNFSSFFLFSSSTTAPNDKIKLTFKNCIFDGNFEKYTTKEALDLYTHDRGCDAIFQDCIFTSNNNYTDNPTISIKGAKVTIKGSGTNTSQIHHNREYKNAIYCYDDSSKVDIQNTAINVSVKTSEETIDYELFRYCNFDNCTFNVSSEVKIDAVFKYCNLSNSTFDGKEMVTQKNFIYGTNAYAGVCGKQGLTNCTITNVKAESYLFYDWDNGNIDSSEIRSCSGAISIHDDINNSRLFNYNCSEQNIDTIKCWGDITDSSIYGWTTYFRGDKIQNTSFNFCINDGRGGAVNISPSSNSKEVLIENCVFSNCKSTEQQDKLAGGGAIAIECLANNIGVTIKNCRFNSNEASLKGCDIFMCAKWNDGSSYSGCVLDLQDCYSDYITDYGPLFGNSLSLFTNNVTKKGNMLAL